MSCPEEVAYFKGFITRDNLLDLAAKYGKSGYGAYLVRVAKGDRFPIAALLLSKQIVTNRDQAGPAGTDTPSPRFPS